MNNIIKKTEEITKKTFCKCKQFTQKMVDNVEKDLIDKSPLSKKDVSGDATFVGEKVMTTKQFVGSATHFARYGFSSTLAGKVEFTPEHRAFELKLSHNMKIWMFYSRKRNETYVFVTDRGFFDLGWGDQDSEGVALKYKGVMSFDDFVESDRSTQLFRRLYKEHEAELAKERKAEKAEDDAEDPNIGDDDYSRFDFGAPISNAVEEVFGKAL